MITEHDVVYSIEYKPPGARKWRRDDNRFSTSMKEILELAEEWWGPDGYDYEYRIVSFRRSGVINSE